MNEISGYESPIAVNSIPCSVEFFDQHGKNNIFNLNNKSAFSKAFMHFNPFSQIPETKSRLRESLGARFRKQNLDSNSRQLL